VTLHNQISNWILDYLKNNNLKTLVIGISGGIDSAVTSTLCAMTGYPTKLLVMPIYQNNEETIRGLNHCDFLKKKYNNVEIIKTDLSRIYDSFVDIVPKDYQNKLSLANTRARIRMTTLYVIAGGCKGIVVGTGNKVEDFGVGFFTKYGDGGVDISPIADLMKSEVYKLAKYLCINEEIINVPPTDGLWDDGRTDEEQLGVSYDDLEWAMYIKEGNINNVLSEKDKNILNKYMEHRSQNLHKMKPIPVFKKK
jgi:NAD+ synthase